MAPISKSDLDQISNTIALAMQQGFAQLTQALAAQPKAQPAQAKTASYKYSTPFLPRGSKAAPSDLVSKDAAIVARFAKRGFKVTLMDRNDPKAPFDVRPFKGWLDQGRVVRKGQKGVKGLLHVSQTDAIASAKPTKAKKKS
jgi:hypothetical protein